MSDDMRPRCGVGGVPLCEEGCPSYDGKRCRLTGFRPGSICDPAVQEMAAELREWRRLGSELVTARNTRRRPGLILPLASRDLNAMDALIIFSENHPHE